MPLAESREVPPPIPIMRSLFVSLLKRLQDMQDRKRHDMKDIKLSHFFHKNTPVPFNVPLKEISFAENTLSILANDFSD